MLEGCSFLLDLKGLQKWNVLNGNDFSYMLEGYSSLGNNFSYMFCRCS